MQRRSRRLWKADLTMWGKPGTVRMFPKAKHVDCPRFAESYVNCIFQGSLLRFHIQIGEIERDQSVGLVVVVKLDRLDSVPLTVQDRKSFLCNGMDRDNGEIGAKERMSVVIAYPLDIDRVHRNLKRVGDLQEALG